MRSVLLVIAGLWAGLLLAAGAAATLSFRSVDRALDPRASPELGARLAPLAADARRQALRHVASESNRALFAKFDAVIVTEGTSLFLKKLKLQPIH